MVAVGKLIHQCGILEGIVTGKTGGPVELFPSSSNLRVSRSSPFSNGVGFLKRELRALRLVAPRDSEWNNVGLKLGMMSVLLHLIGYSYYQPPPPPPDSRMGTYILSDPLCYASPYMPHV